MASHTPCEACSSAFSASFSPPVGSATGGVTPESGCYSTEEHFFALPGPNPRYPWLWAGAGPCCGRSVASLGGVVRPVATRCGPTPFKQVGKPEAPFVVHSSLSCGGRSIRCVVVPLSFGVVVHRTVIGVLSTNIVSLSCGSCWLRCLVVVRL